MQKDEKNKNEQKPDFVDRFRSFDKLDNGLKAALRRVATPDDLRDTAAIYRLFHEARPNDQWLRVVFLFPWCEHRDNAPSFGALLAEANVNVNRLFQMSRALEPLDLILLRRMAIQIKPALNWEKFGELLYYWNLDNKRQIIEDYFYYKSIKTKKGA